MRCLSLIYDLLSQQSLRSLHQFQPAVNHQVAITILRFFIIVNRPYFELKKGQELCSISFLDQSEGGVRVVAVVVQLAFGRDILRIYLEEQHTIQT